MSSPVAMTLAAVRTPSALRWVNKSSSEYWPGPADADEPAPILYLAAAASGAWMRARGGLARRLRREPPRAAVASSAASGERRCVTATAVARCGAAGPRRVHARNASGLPRRRGWRRGAALSVGRWALRALSQLKGASQLRRDESSRPTVAV